MKTLAQHLEVINTIVHNNRLIADRVSKLEALGYKVENRAMGSGGVHQVKKGINCLWVQISYGVSIHNYAYAVQIPKTDIKPLSDTQVQRIISLADEGNAYRVNSTYCVWDTDKVGYLSDSQKSALNKAWKFKKNKNSRKVYTELKYYTALTSKF